MNRTIMKKQDLRSAPRDKQRIVISIIGWIIDLIIHSVRKKKLKAEN